MKLFSLFKPKLQNFVLIGLSLLLVQQVLNAQVSGTVFRDFNDCDMTENSGLYPSSARDLISSLFKRGNTSFSLLGHLLSLIALKETTLTGIFTLTYFNYHFS